MRIILEDREVEVTEKQIKLLFYYYMHPSPPKEIIPKLEQIRGFDFDRQQQLTGLEYARQVADEIRKKRGLTPPASH